MRLILFALLLTACSPALDPAGAGYYYAGLTTATREAADAQATAAPVTQSAREYEYAQSLTATFAPLAATATANANDATRIANLLAAQRATSEARYVESAGEATQQALAVLESKTQKTIQDNNAAIARSVIGLEAWRFFLWGVAVVMLMGVFAAVVIALYYFQNFIFVRGQVYERRAWDRAEIDNEIYARSNGFQITSAGLMQLSAPTIAEKHVQKYIARPDQWRAAGKRYIAAAIELERKGVTQPYSRANAAKDMLITHPDRGGWWQLGHDRLIKVLLGMGVLGSSGKGGEVRLIVDVDAYSRMIDLSPYSDWPPDPIPSVKITLAGSQVVRDLAG